MTPQLALTAPEGINLCSHLSEDQFGELLALSPAGAACDAHLLNCEQCAGELAAMRNSLGMFRDASRAYADNELRRLPQMALPSRRPITPMQPAWWLAAAAILLTALAPMQMQRLRGIHSVTAATGEIATTSSAQSDEALLEDVDREASASLPAPMQALANPSTSLDASTPLADQRKD